MILLEQTRNGCDSAQVSERAHVGSPVAVAPKRIRGGVGIPGGFTNTNHDPRAGGAVVLLGGISNASFV
jgi:hypothetical protein